MKYILRILPLLLLAVSLNAQFLIDWQKSFDGGRNDFGKKIYFDSEGNMILSGTSFDESFMPDAAVIKYSSEGEFLWAQTYNIGSDDRPIGIYFDSEDNILMGVLGSDSSVYQDDFHLVKISKDGELMFGQRVAWYIQPGFDMIAEARAKELYADNFGNLVLAGPTSQSRIWMVKLDYNGNFVSKSLDTLATIQDYYIEEYNTFFNPSTAHLYFGCQFINSSLRNNHYGIIQTDNGGNILNYQQIFSFGDKYMYTELVDYEINSSNRYYLALDIHNQNVWSDSVNYFPRVTCVSPDGEVVWDVVIEASPGFDKVSKITSIDLDIGGNIWTTGSVDSKFFIAKLSGAGEITWMNIDSNYSVGSKITCDQRDGIVAVYDKNGYDIWIIKYDQFGNQLTKYFIPGKNVYTPAYINDLQVKPNRKLLALGTIYNTTWNWELYQLDDPTVDVENNIKPSEFSLSQNYPNPFNPTTSIKYSVPSNEYVSLKVYDILGKEIAVLVNQRMNKGVYQVTFDASHLTSGVYLYKIQTGLFTDVKKLLLLK